jgi:hypothetical protein
MRVRHPGIDPAQITHRLGFEPQHAWACGDARISGEGVREGVRRESYWSAKLPKTSERMLAMFAPMARETAARETATDFDEAQLMLHAFDLPAYLGLYLLQLKRERDFVQQLAREGDVTLIVAIDAAAGANLRLEPSLLRQVADLGLRLEFEFD